MKNCYALWNSEIIPFPVILLSGKFHYLFTSLIKVFAKYLKANHDFLQIYWKQMQVKVNSLGLHYLDKVHSF